MLDPEETVLAQVNLTELAALAGMTDAAISYRVAHGHLSPPAGGLFDRARALAELAAKPKANVGPRPGQRKPRGDTRDGAQAEIRYRNARADREELVAERLRRDSSGISASQQTPSRLGAGIHALVLNALRHHRGHLLEKSRSQ